MALRDHRLSAARLLTSLGVDPFAIGSALQWVKDLPQKSSRVRGLYAEFWADHARLQEQYANSAKEFPIVALSPQIHDRYADSGGGLARGQYFQQDLLVAQWIFQDAPAKHMDVGSRIDGFVTHVASFREIEVLDIRPLPFSIRNVQFRQCDLMADDPSMAACTPSLSCLHTLEHFGLGRYGDPVDYYGYRRGWENLQRIIQPGGRLYFSVPFGRSRIEFNSQRVFGRDHLAGMIDKFYEIERFAYIDDAGRLIPDSDFRSEDGRENFGCRYGCAIFTLRKRS